MQGTADAKGKAGKMRDACQADALDLAGQLREAGQGRCVR
jgi:hypothetical protein